MSKRHTMERYISSKSKKKLDDIIEESDEANHIFENYSKSGIDNVEGRQEKQSWEMGTDFSPYQREKNTSKEWEDEEKYAKRLQSLIRGRHIRDDFLKKKRATKKIQSRLRGNIVRRETSYLGGPQRGVPYRETNWKDIVQPIDFDIEKKILKNIISGDMDDIIEKIDKLEKEYEGTKSEIEYLERINETVNLTPEEVIKLKEKLREMNEGQVTRGEELHQLDKLLKEIKSIDLFQCNAIKKIIKADLRLLKADDINLLTKPCLQSDTTIYINSIYSLPWELFHPLDPDDQSNYHSIYSKIKSFPDEIFTNYGKSMLRKTLEELGLMYENILHNDKTDGESDRYYRDQLGDRWLDTQIIESGDNPRLAISGRMTRFELLANFYRWSNYDRGVDLKHLQTIYYEHPSGKEQFPHLRAHRADGRSSLEETLELFEANIRGRGKVKNTPDFGEPYIMIDFPEEYDIGQEMVGEDYLDKKIKLMKKHFIKALIGMDDLDFFSNFIRERIKSLKEKLPLDVEGLKDWEKNEKLDNLTLDEWDNFMEYSKKIKNYEFILLNLENPFYRPEGSVD